MSPIRISEIQNLTPEQRQLLLDADRVANGDGNTSRAEVDAYLAGRVGITLQDAQVLDRRIAGLEPPRFGELPRTFELNEQYWTFPGRAVLDVIVDGRDVGTVQEPIIRFGGANMSWHDGNGDLVATAKKPSGRELARYVLPESTVKTVIQITDADDEPIGAMVERRWDTYESGHQQTRYEIWVAGNDDAPAAISEKNQGQDSRIVTFNHYAYDTQGREGRGQLIGTATRLDGPWYTVRSWSDSWNAERIPGAVELHPAFLVFAMALKTEAGDDSTTTPVPEEG